MEYIPYGLIVLAVLMLISIWIDFFSGKAREDEDGPLIIKVKYFTDITPLEKIAVGDWIDLRAGQRIELYQGQYAAIPLGLAMELPAGYEALITPRSSTYKRLGIIQVNSPAVIDESYSGPEDEWHMLVYAMRDTTIEKNERICQFRIFKHQPETWFEKVESLGKPSRGGIGSTGES